jgi:hypothetical protein
MPYLTQRPPAKRLRALTVKGALAGTLAVFVGGLASAPAMAATQSCSNPLLTQAFLGWGDSNQYTPAPGESADSFAGSGWTLSGGASIITTTLADGSTGPVLNLPSGSVAVSPVMCVNSAMPTARTMIRDVAGSEGVFFYINYPNAPGWKNTGQVHGQGNNWSLSGSVNIQTNGLAGWTLGQFEFVGGGNPQNPSDFQLYNFYVDPYAKG